MCAADILNLNHWSDSTSSGVWAFFGVKLMNWIDSQKAVIHTKGQPNRQMMSAIFLPDRRVLRLHSPLKKNSSNARAFHLMSQQWKPCSAVSTFGRERSKSGETPTYWDFLLRSRPPSG